MMTTTTQSPSTKPSFLERRLVAAWAINWEMVFYGLILLIAVATRFYGLGDRVISHDESMHAYFSLKIYNGEGYIHDPRVHGPLQFFLTALSFLLFGDNDFTARIPAAVFGVILVILPYGFRPWLGKVGALVACVGLLISPGLLFYQRYIRNDALIAVFTVLMALSLFQYMRTRQIRWLYIGTAAVSLSLSTKEIALIHGFLGLLFIGAVVLWEQLSAKRLKTLTWLLAGATAATSVALLLGVNKNVLLVMGLFMAVLTVARNTGRRNKPVSGIVRFLKNVDITGPLALAMVIFVLLYTAFFSNMHGLITGTYGAVAHWLGQQGVARGGQPGYYYLMLLLLYEFMPFFVGGVGGLVYLMKKAPAFALVPEPKKKKGLRIAPYPSDGGTFAAYLIFWAIGSFVIYSWAGEKMPWLNVHVTLPFIFLMGHVSQGVVEQWTLRGRRVGPALYWSVLALLAALTIRFVWLSNFVNYDYVNEYLVYAHGAPDIKWVLNRVDDLSARTVGDRQIKIAYGGIAWPLEWYMRLYPNKTFFGDNPTAEALDAPVILFAPNSNLSDVTVEDVEALLGNRYNRFDYRLVWWPPEDYKDQTLSQLWHNYAAADSDTLRQNWESLWQIVFYRNNINYSLDHWPNRTPLYLFVDKTLAEP